MPGEDATYLGRPDLPVHRFPDRFADAEASFEDARFVVLGLPYDRTVSYRAGTALGPAAVRQASWNLETFNVRNRVDVRDVPVHDLGDLDLAGLEPDAMFDRVLQTARRIVRAGKFPLAVGGEHSTTPAVAHALAERHPDLRVLQIDAHLDYRREYEGSANNHACAARRIADAVGPGRLAVVGVRSAEAEEVRDAERDGVHFSTAYDVHADGMGRVLERALAALGDGPLHVTLDIDALDPAYAPATGTPETFGLAPVDVLRAVVRTADRLVGFDVVEVSPPWDSGNTAAVAAKILREVVTESWWKRPSEAAP